MEALFGKQQIIAEAIHKIEINFKKDSKDRKTCEYINKRVESLEALWREFDSNNETLSTLTNKSHEYFTTHAYEQIKTEYNRILDTLMKFEPVKSEERGVPSKSDELIQQQRTNFRAFSRVVRNIHIEAITEKWELEDKLKTLQARWKVIDDTHWEIDNLLIASDISYEQDYNKYEDIFETTKRELNMKLNSTAHQHQSVPKIEIPTFSGNYSQWATFMDLYCEAIHKNNMITKAQKMQHLKGKLRGEAERLVQHLHVSAENYDTCWDILTHRYNNLQLLFTQQIQTFMNQPSIQQQGAAELKRLYDTSMETINAIHNLGVDISTWDPILVHIITTKLDSSTYADYMESRKAPRELPNYDELMSFLENKFLALEPLNKKQAASHPNKPKPAFTREIPQPQRESQNNADKYKRFIPKTYHANIERNCPVCKTNHLLINCKKFQDMTTEIKLKTIAQLNICKNCLYSHNGKQCISIKRCRVCNEAHHTTLHDMLRDTGATTSSGQSRMAQGSNSQRNVNHVADNYNEVLLATMQLKVRAADGTYVILRCLLDQGSQINLITENAAQRLGLPRQHQNATVCGIGIFANHSNGTVQLACESLYGDYQFFTEALVMTKVLNNLPNYSFEKQDWPHLHNIKLADPNYNISRPVDILLDASVYAHIAMSGILRGPAQAPIAQQTKVGWVLLGNVKTFNCHVVLNNLDEISQFWEIEEITETSKHMTSQEQYCETLYANTTTRLESGRYEVKIPMKPHFEKELGASKPQAVAQFKQLEKRLAKNEIFSDSYKKFINEYKMLEHMKRCTLPREPSCYLPHHGVLRPDSLTTKLRVVFNGSAKTTSGQTLNQLMESGPNLQQDIQAMILRWRAFQYVYTADIEKFYRQILIKEEDQHLQKIVWRDTNTDPLVDYQLCTVTYGTKAAPFLAMRTIKQLVMDDGHLYPLAANILSDQLYVDDLLGGNNTVQEAQEAQQQLIAMLKGGGFNLRKWASNTASLLENLTEDQINHNMLDFKQAETNKTLGITWNPRTDQFTFKLTPALSDKHDVITKRTLLSDLSKLYDPLGWLSPVTTKAKIIFQQVWTQSSNWDEPLPENIQHEWSQFQQELTYIDSINIPRWIGNTQQPIELHGFSDASERAYGCVIFCKSTDEKGVPIIKLVAGKTKLAPLRKPTSLPRLELCGALLLSRLMKKVIESINAQTVTVRGWTDSMVVLGWIQGEPSRWKSFVANRVVQITENMAPSCWRHVKSEENPADCTSRGLSPSQLISHTLWWEGPAWLKTNIIPNMETYVTNEEVKKQKQVCTIQKTAPLVEYILQQYSSMTRVTRILGWIMRFIRNARANKSAERISHLTKAEIETAHNMIVRTVQNNNFADDILQLQKHCKTRTSSKILNLFPFIDDQNILRVGGRLDKSNLDQSQKHPIILPNKGKLTELLIDQAHRTTLHGGAKLTLQYLRNKYWIVGGMNIVKKQLRKCVTCHRYKTQNNNNQLMGDLPKPRVTPSRPFTHTGVDFTGQVEVKANKGRGIKTTKAYIAIFICMCTKAIHLELVSDLTTAAFIAALKRLCARRGTPQHMYSDNGTNFVGAARTLTKERKEAMKLYINDDFLNNILDIGIEWHFNAPSWPTAGGLWEAAVKSMKHHLKRVLGEQKLTFEEFSTLLAHIEACLNSRPLVALTNNIEDVECLTPGHFLVGGPVLAPPLSADIDNRSLTTRWHLTEKMYKDFWKRWANDYLQTLQTRSKWNHTTKNIEIGDLVLVKDEQVPPARWLMGRVVKTHPGADGLVRVVTVKTKTSNMKRPVTKLSRLPIEQENKHSPETETQESINIPSDQPRRQLRPRKPKNALYSYMCCLFFLIATCIQPSSTQLVNVTTLDPTKLLYFDKLADMQIIQDEWKMVVFYNMSSYWESLSNIEKYVIHLNSLCTQEPAYITIATQLRHELNELKHYNNVLKTEHGRRIKRGLVDGLGYIANSLFGVLDERFARKYYKDIKYLQENENHLLRLYKQHTSILEGEFNIMKRNEQVMNTQFSIINNHLKEIENKVAADQRNSMYITASALAANMVISNLRNVQQSILDLVTDVRNGRVDSHLLKPDEFEKQLNIISGQIPKGFSLPCTNSYGCIREMYTLSRVHVRLTDDFLIFEVKIPLVTSEQYEITRVLPINNIRDQTIITVIPTTQYMAVNLQKDLLILLQQTDISSCIHMNEHKLLCNFNLPIYDIKTTNTICEAQVINNGLASSCRTAVSDCRDDWLKLNSRGAWLFTCCQECTSRIFCPAGITSQTLRSTGIVTLAEGCVLRGNHHVIHAHNKFQSEVQVNNEEIYVPDSGINHFVKISSNITFLPETHEEQMKTLKKRIELVKEQQESISLTSTTNDVHHYSMYSFMSIVCLLICVWIGLKIKQRRRRQTLDETDSGQHLEMKTLAHKFTLARHGSEKTTHQRDNNTTGSKMDRSTSPARF